MVRKALAGAAGLAALITGVAICLVALAFALYFSIEPGLGRAAAAGLVGLVFALVLIIVALSAGARRQAREDPDLGIVEKLFTVAKDRPLMSAAAAVAATIIAFRNPALVATIVATFMDRSKHDR